MFCTTDTYISVALVFGDRAIIIDAGTSPLPSQPFQWPVAENSEFFGMA